MNSEITLAKPHRAAAALAASTIEKTKWDRYDLYDMWWDEDLFA